MSSAREEVFDSIRRHLSRDPHRGPRRELEPYVRAEEIPPEARARRFEQALDLVGAPLYRVRSEEQAAAVVASLLQRHEVARLAITDAPLVQRLASTLPTEGRVEATAPREDLLQAQAGLSTAQWGIAETGTLVLESESERHRLVSLLPPLHIVVLEAPCLLGTLGDALAALQRDGVNSLDRAVTFVTGPSRTADIELTLVVGVHGPKALHVLLLDPESTS